MLFRTSTPPNLKLLSRYLSLGDDLKPHERDSVESVAKWDRGVQSPRGTRSTGRPACNPFHLPGVDWVWIMRRKSIGPSRSPTAVPRRACVLQILSGAVHQVQAGQPIPGRQPSVPDPASWMSGSVDRGRPGTSSLGNSRFPTRLRQWCWMPGLWICGAYGNAGQQYPMLDVRPRIVNTNFRSQTSTAMPKSGAPNMGCAFNTFNRQAAGVNVQNVGYSLFLPFKLNLPLTSANHRRSLSEGMGVIMWFACAGTTSVFVALKQDHGVLSNGMHTVRVLKNNRNSIRPPEWTIYGNPAMLDFSGIGSGHLGAAGGSEPELPALQDWRPWVAPPTYATTEWAARYYHYYTSLARTRTTTHIRPTTTQTMYLPRWYTARVQPADQQLDLTNGIRLVATWTPGFIFNGSRVGPALMGTSWSE
ncbi:hypothetical protein FB45DRAFT_873397 [Roridomyces roridus]|uniref:Uncharacterized protein n=1 Tax=Roridomyces roridus TaxID=1738132 RepID=A0AAD7BC44_9AGAR|nr:hypothetical protein FB45DRAFT_873397 [Roridomyces roridus]